MVKIAEKRANDFEKVKLAVKENAAVELVLITWKNAFK